MLEYCIAQDIRHGKGVAVIDPHSDLAAKILEGFPNSRYPDAIDLIGNDLVTPEYCGFMRPVIIPE